MIRASRRISNDLNGCFVRNRKSVRWVRQVALIMSRWCSNQLSYAPVVQWERILPPLGGLSTPISDRRKHQADIPPRAPPTSRSEGGEPGGEENAEGAGLVSSICRYPAAIRLRPRGTAWRGRSRPRGRAGIRLSWWPHRLACLRYRGPVR